ncbi:MAG: hypothetical protein ACTSQE_16485, partial [Candidatus Heimdallarchaeaceae archaeon]
RPSFNLLSFMLVEFSCGEFLFLFFLCFLSLERLSTRNLYKKVTHGANYRINSVIETVDPSVAVKCFSYQYAKENEILDSRKDWILFAPLKSGRNEFNAYLKRKYDAKLFAFSGWCQDSSYKYRMSVDHGIVISDHPDFQELLTICEASNPDIIYTIYGSNIEFAGELRRRGFDALPLSSQSTLDSFFLS